MSNDHEVLTGLREALAFSPENLPLRRQLAHMLLGRGMVDEAAQLVREGLTLTAESEQLKLLLARCFERQGQTAEALVVVEDLAKRPDAEPGTHLLLARLLMKRGELDRAATAYRRAIAADPALADETLAEALGVTDANDADGDASDDDVDEFGRVLLRADEKEAPAGFEMEKPSTSFADVGGMEALKDEIRIKIIEPIRNVELYAAYGKAVGGGILMYGPPGCGKTYLARATAGEIDAGFIAVGIHDVLDMYLGQSEQRLHALFEYARQHTPCVLFFDEVDALGAKRTDMAGSAGRQVINQFLSELDGVKSSNDGVLVLGATNAPWHLDSAFRRPGRFDRILFVPPPDETARAETLRVLMKGKPQDAVDFEAVARKTPHLSGADLKAVVDVAVEAKLRDAMKSGRPTPVSTKDLLRGAKAVKPSTREWFATARNYALYSNESGLYDDILTYMKLK
ncbi:MAG: AAA family ATPase [Phycisphaeraceae bacterium]